MILLAKKNAVHGAGGKSGAPLRWLSPGRARRFSLRGPARLAITGKGGFGVACAAVEALTRTLAIGPSAMAAVPRNARVVDGKGSI